MKRVVAEPRWSAHIGGMSRCLVSTVNRNGTAMEVDDVAIAIREQLVKCGRQATAGDIGCPKFRGPVALQWRFVYSGYFRTSAVDCLNHRFAKGFSSLRETNGGPAVPSLLLARYHRHRRQQLRHILSRSKIQLRLDPILYGIMGIAFFFTSRSILTPSSPSFCS